MPGIVFYLLGIGSGILIIFLMVLVLALIQKKRINRNKFH